MRTITLREDLLIKPEAMAKNSGDKARNRIVWSTAKTQPMEVVHGKDGGYQYTSNDAVPVEKTVKASIAAGDVYHRNFLEYLELCWASHHGVVVTPDILWHHVMSEVAAHIIANAEDYRKFFTEAESGQTEIVMDYDGSSTVINLQVLIPRLRQLVPSDISAFLPEFSTTTPDVSMAIYAAFCEAMTPYYSYSVQLCGIPSFMVCGTAEDWELLAASAEGVAKLVGKAEDYLNNIAVIARDIAVQARDGLDKDFWDGMFSIKRCGSGSQEVVDGWILRTYMEEPSLAFVRNFPTHVSRVPFDVIDEAGRRTPHSLNCGMFSSKALDGFLVPSFGWVLNVQTAEVTDKVATGVMPEEAMAMVTAGA